MVCVVSFQSLAVSWLFPGKKVRIDSPCLDCGEPITIEMRDGIIEKADPEGLIGHQHTFCCAYLQGIWRQCHRSCD